MSKEHGKWHQLKIYHFYNSLFILSAVRMFQEPNILSFHIDNMHITHHFSSQQGQSLSIQNQNS